MTLFRSTSWVRHNLNMNWRPVGLRANQKAVRELAKKYLPVAWLCLLCVPPTNVCADVVNGIDILSSDYYVNAPWSYTWYQSSFPQDQIYSSGSENYGGSRSDGSPLVVQLGPPYPPGLSFPPGLPGPELGGSTSIDRFYFANSTDSIRGGRSFLGSDGNYYSIVSAVNMQAQASWAFRPTTDTMQITLSINSRGQYDYPSPYSGLSVALSDVTHFGTLLSFSESDTWNRTINVSNTFSVSTSDTYVLEVSSWADTYSSDFAI